MQTKNNTPARLIFGIILIVLGGLFLLDNYGITSFSFSLPDFLFHWEYILIGLGLFIILSYNNKTAGIILITIGFFNLFPDFWPLILVGLGIYIILRRKSPKDSFNKDGINGNPDTYSSFGEEEKNTDNITKDNIDDVSIFGGGTKNFSSRNFTGGKLTAIFGGSDIHLENCSLAHGQNELDLFVMFGGYTIYVPQDWNVIVDLVPIFGGFSDKRIKDPNRVYEDNKILVIKGLVLFGGGEIKF